MTNFGITSNKDFPGFELPIEDLTITEKVLGTSKTTVVNSNEFMVSTKDDQKDVEISFMGLNLGKLEEVGEEEKNYDNSGFSLKMTNTEFSFNGNVFFMKDFKFELKANEDIFLTFDSLNTSKIAIYHESLTIKYTIQKLELKKIKALEKKEESENQENNDLNIKDLIKKYSLDKTDNDLTETKNTFEFKEEEQIIGNKNQKKQFFLKSNFFYRNTLKPPKDNELIDIDKLRELETNRINKLTKTKFPFLWQYPIIKKSTNIIKTQKLVLKKEIESDITLISCEIKVDGIKRDSRIQSFPLKDKVPKQNDGHFYSLKQLCHNGSDFHENDGNFWERNFKEFNFLVFPDRKSTV